MAEEVTTQPLQHRLIVELPNTWLRTGTPTITQARIAAHTLDIPAVNADAITAMEDLSGAVGEDNSGLVAFGTVTGTSGPIGCSIIAKTIGAIETADLEQIATGLSDEDPDCAAMLQAVELPSGDLALRLSWSPYNAVHQTRIHLSQYYLPYPPPSEQTAIIVVSVNTTDNDQALRIADSLAAPTRFTPTLS